MDDLPLSTIPTTAPLAPLPLFRLREDPPPPSHPTATSQYSSEKAIAGGDPDAPEEKKRRVDVDDPLADPKEVILQLRADLARAQASLRLAADAHFRLSLREQEHAELKRRLYAAHAPPDGLPFPPNPLLNDHLILVALKRQAAEIQRLKEDVERERDFTDARKFNPSRLGSLKLVSKVHALVKENAGLGADIAQEEAPDKWFVIDLHKQFIERTRAETEAVVSHTAKLKQQLQETEGTIFSLQQAAKTGDPAALGRRPPE